MSSAILFYEIMKCNVMSTEKGDTLEILLHEYQVLGNWDIEIPVPVPVLARSCGTPLIEFVVQNLKRPPFWCGPKLNGFCDINYRRLLNKWDWTI